MSVAHLGPLYHWSPTDRRASIEKEGLRVGADTTVNRGHRNAWVSLGFSPSGAWVLSGAMPWVECEEWDLWQVTLPDTASTHVRAEFGPVMQEIYVMTTIPPASLWLVGTRRT